MYAKFKKLFHIPTWIIFFLAFASVGALLIDISLIININSSESIAIGPIVHHKGSDGYVEALQEMKRAIAISGIVSMAVAIFSIRSILMRRKQG